MSALRIVFMGTPEFAVTSLDMIVRSSHEVVGVITAPDKPAGRGRKVSESAVKQYAQKKGLTLLQPVKLRDPEFLEKLQGLKADLFVVVAFRMLPEVVWKIPEKGTFNLHASLLPQYRGAAPINWAIINGESETGVTTFFINEKIDTGEVLLQEKIAIGDAETAGELHDRLMQLGAELVLKTIELIASGQVTTKKQPEFPDLRPAPKIHKETCKIEWRGNPSNIINHIRGLSPYPGAWSVLQNDGQELGMKVFRAHFETAEHNLANGKVIATKNTLKVAVQGGFVFLEHLQLSGKRKMAVRDVLNGLKIDHNAKMS